MHSDFTLAAARITSYKLVIIDRKTPTVLLQAYLSFHNDCEFYNEDGLKQFQDYLSDMLDELPKEKWDKENILKVVKELMSETPFSHSGPMEICDNRRNKIKLKK